MNDREKYLEEKRIKVLEAIKPICETFNITDYDYIVNTKGQDEILRIRSVYIGCSSDSITAIIDELIGYIFITTFCHHRSLGAFEKQTLNVIKRYWIKEERLKALGLI